MISEAINFSAALGAARNQGNRPTCLAFASSDLNRFANNVDVPLSVEYLCHGLVKHQPGWQPGEGFSMSSAIAALRSPGQPEEYLYPYLSANEATPHATAPIGLSPLYTCEAIQRNLSTDGVISRVTTGSAVALIVRVTQTFYKPDNGIIQFSPSFVPNVLHALLAVGVGEYKDSKQTHVFIRNSWGNGWGLNGHAWLPRLYLDTHLQGSFTL